MCDDEFEEDYKEIQNSSYIADGFEVEINIQQKISKEKYISKVGKMLEHINRGDIYEAFSLFHKPYLS